MVVCIWGCKLNLDPSSLESAPIDRCKGMVIYIIAESCKKMHNCIWLCIPTSGAHLVVQEERWERN